MTGSTNIIQAPFNAAVKALEYSGSLVGRTIKLDRTFPFDAQYRAEHDGQEYFDVLHGHAGLKSGDEFVVTFDNEGKTLDRSHHRKIKFQDSEGHEGLGSAWRFVVVDPSDEALLNAHRIELDRIAKTTRHEEIKARLALEEPELIT